MGEVRATSATGGEKGRKDIELHNLLAMAPAHFLTAVGEVYEYGAHKYARDNWRKGYPWSWSMNALLRHVKAVSEGEWLDPESGKPHLAHAMFHSATLHEFHRLDLGENDLWGEAPAEAEQTVIEQAMAQAEVEAPPERTYYLREPMGQYDGWLYLDTLTGLARGDWLMIQGSMGYSEHGLVALVLDHEDVSVCVTRATRANERSWLPKGAKVIRLRRFGE